MAGLPAAGASHPNPPIGVADGRSCELIRVVIHSSELNKLVRAIPVEREASATVDDLSLRVLVPGEDESGGFGCLVVVERPVHLVACQ